MKKRTRSYRLLSKRLSKFWATSVLLLYSFAYLNGPAIASDIENSIVTIYTTVENQGSGQGTGFYIGKGGRILTAYHVVDGATQITIYDQKGRKYTDIEILALSPEFDLAVLKVNNARNKGYLKYTKSAPSPEEKLTIIGSPRGLPNQKMFGHATSDGLISSLALSSRSGKAIFNTKIDILPLDITIYNGLSGAPILNSNFELVGVLSGSFDEGRGVAWAIPSKYISEVFSSIAQSQSVDNSFIWPAFRLMSNSWRSLKRSYSKHYTAKHIQKLEVLEGLLDKIGGEWTINMPSVETIFEYYGDDRCIKRMSRDDSMIRITGIDYEEPSLIGAIRVNSSFSAQYIPGYMGHNPFTEKECYKQVTGDSSNSTGAIHIEGDFRGFNYKSRNDRVKAKIYVKECLIGRCTGSVYGKKSLGTFRIITEDKMTSGETVFLRN